MGRRRQARRSSLAIWVLMLGLCFAPSLALAASACTPPCCPVEAERADCSSGFAKQACCTMAPTPLVGVSPMPVEMPVGTPGLPTLSPRSEGVWTGRLSPRPRFVEAELGMRSSPLARSVVLLI